MNEKVIIKSKRLSKSLILYYSLAVATLVCLLYSILNLYNAYNSYDVSEGYRSFGFAAASMKSATASIVIFPLVTVVVYFSSRFLTIFSITVTDKRVYGIKKIFFWQKSINLPIDSITSCVLINVFGILSIKTPSGRITFPFNVNAKDIYHAVNELLIERCNNK